MNSFTGVGHADGTKTGKVIAYATRSKRCTTGYTAELLKKIKKKEPSKKHDRRARAGSKAGVLTCWIRSNWHMVIGTPASHVRFVPY